MIIYCDGGSRGNPGPAASAFVVTQDKQSLTTLKQSLSPSGDEKVIYKESKYLGIETNNVAEYTAVLLAVNWLSEQLKIKNEKIIINLDSQLVERQLNGHYKVKNLKLKVLFDQIKFLILNSSLLISFKWNYRTDNELADDLVNEELDRSAMTRVRHPSTGK